MKRSAEPQGIRSYEVVHARMKAKVCGQQVWLCGCRGSAAECARAPLTRGSADDSLSAASGGVLFNCETRALPAPERMPN